MDSPDGTFVRVCVCVDAYFLMCHAHVSVYLYACAHAPLDHVKQLSPLFLIGLLD